MDKYSITNLLHIGNICIGCTYIFFICTIAKLDGRRHGSTYIEITKYQLKSSKFNPRGKGRRSK